MCLPILGRIVIPVVVKPHTRPSISFLSLASSVSRCYRLHFLSYACVVVEFICAFLDLYHLSNHFMPYLISVIGIAVVIFF